MGYNNNDNNNNDIKHTSGSTPKDQGVSSSSGRGNSRRTGLAWKIALIAAIAILVIYSDAEVTLELQAILDLVSNNNDNNNIDIDQSDDSELLRRYGRRRNRTRWRPSTARNSRSHSSSAPPSSFYTPRIPKRSPHHVFTCGWDTLFSRDRRNDSLAYALFPECNVTHLTTLEGISPFQEDDVMMYPCGGECPVHESVMSTNFPGTILLINGESEQWKCRAGPPSDRFYGLDKIQTPDPNNVNNATTFVPAMYLASLPIHVRESMYDPSKRAINNGQHFLIYAHSNCVGYREEAFRQLSKIGPVRYGGPCSGGGGVGEYDAEVASGGWGHNANFFRNYRFVLAMENTPTDGYISEKIMHPFFAGSIPIYYGTRQVFDVFNDKAFIWYDIDNPQIALDRVAYLESNKTAYMEMFQEPILAHGEETIAKYFSLRDSEGGGRLKWAIRERIGFG